MNQNTLIQVPAALLEKTASYVEVTSLTLGKAFTEIGTHRQAREKAAGLIDPLLQHMLAAGVVPSQHKEAAQAMLGAHDTTLQLLKAATDKIVELKKELGKKAGTLGEGVDELGKQAGDGEAFDSLNGVVGARTQYRKASDIPLLKAAGML